MANWWEEDEVVEAGPKSRPDWGPGAVELPDGSVIRYGPRGGSTVLKRASGDAPGATPELREFEINAAGRATLMDEGLREYERAVADGYNPGSVKNVVARGAEDIWKVGPYIADVIRDDAAERGRSAELQFTDGALRTTSGANAPEPEVVRANRAYFRQPGESAAVEPNKSQIRQRFRDTSVRAAGAAYMPRGVSGEAKAAAPKRPAVPAAARAQAARLRAQGAITQTGAFGTQQNPYVARDAKVFNQLSNDPAYRGKFIIAPDGSFGVIE